MLKIGRIFAVFCILALLMTSGCGNSGIKESYEAAVATLENGDYEAAAKQFSEIINSGNYLAESYRGEAICLMYMQDFARASISFEKALLNLDFEDEEFERDVYSYLAFCRSKQGKTDEALEIYDTLISEKEDPNLLFLRGRIYMSRDMTEAADADFERIVEISDDYELYIAIYEIYDSYRMNANGAAFLEKALGLASSNDDDHYGKGMIYYYLKDYDEAKNELIAALQADSGNKDAILLLGKTYLAMDDIADARAMYKGYAENDETAACAYNGIALCDMAEEMYDSALENIEKGLEVADSEEKKSLLYNEIVVYEKKCDWETARSKAELYIALYPMEEAGQREYNFLENR